MAGSTNKKVLIARFDRESLAGFVNPQEFLRGEGVELLTPEGSVVVIPYSDLRVVCFVRDFESGETWREHRSFAARPKMAGLWLRLGFRDGDFLEGIAPNSLMAIDPRGFTIVPPDPTFQNQRIFVPREALREVQVLGVIGSPLRRRGPRKPGTSEGQLEMFD